MSIDSATERAKWIVAERFEQLFVVLLIASIVSIHWAIDYKIAFLSCYYLPVIVAGFQLGRRGGTYAALLIVGLVAFYQSAIGLDGPSGLSGAILFTLVPWAGFLILTGYTVGRLAQARRERHDELKHSYLAALELLTLQLELTDRQLKGHSFRVATRSVAIAEALGMHPDEIDALRIAALLHELGPDDPRLAILFTAGLGEPRAQSVAVSMQAAQEIVTEFSRYFTLVGNDWPVDRMRIGLGTKVLAVADAFETMQHSTDTRAPLSVWAALEELERGKGTVFATQVVRALQTVVTPNRKTERVLIAV